MSIKDYFNFFTNDLEDVKVDYIVTFHNERPDISDKDNLNDLGIWDKYGTNSYRIWCSLTKEKFENVISEELKISKEEFNVLITSEFVGMRII